MRINIFFSNPTSPRYRNSSPQHGFLPWPTAWPMVTFYPRAHHSPRHMRTLFPAFLPIPRLRAAILILLTSLPTSQQPLSQHFIYFSNFPLSDEEKHSLRGTLWSNKQLTSLWKNRQFSSNLWKHLNNPHVFMAEWLFGLKKLSACVCKDFH